MTGETADWAETTEQAVLDAALKRAGSQGWTWPTTRAAGAEFDAGWQVSGVLDLENCSAGAPAFDFTKLFIEMGGRLGTMHRWWQPLFRGYGEEPDFDLARTLLVGHAHINYACLGVSRWPVRRQDVLDHILGSTSWAELFDLPAPSGD